VTRAGSAPLRLVATCAPGLEPILAGELTTLGFAGVESARSAVRFSGAWPEVWRANYWLRTANRVLVEIASFPAANDEDLYAGAAAVLGGGARPAAASPGARRHRGSPASGALRSRIAHRSLDLAGVPVADLLAPTHTFAVSATSSGSRLRDTRWIALKVKDAIADAQRARFRRRADVDPRRPDVPLRVWLHDDRATLLLDSSREPLDRRGYRKVSGMAPLREQLAAAMVLASGWGGRGPVVDPMCGTGTLLIEAAWVALARAPGALRASWVFERWPGFDASVFARVRGQASRRDSRVVDDASAAPASLRLIGRDLSSDAIRAARVNLDAAGLAGIAEVEAGDGFALEAPPGPGLILTNPAYGDRLETSDEEWRRLGDLLKQKYADWRCAVIAGEPSFGKHIGLRPERRIATKNGPLDARILVFDLYRGSQRDASGRPAVRSSAFPRNAGGSES
jgi:23S rRNA G2445 N2-methylase RlmL